MFKTLSDASLTSALMKIERLRGDKRTVVWSRFGAEDKEVIQSGYKEMKLLLDKLAVSADAKKNQLFQSMGKYQTNNNAFPHIWGALIPVDCKNASTMTPQMFVFRDHEVLRWGIGLSAKA